MKKFDKKGFTIVELVIVIAVIAILAGIMIPTFANVTDNAKKAAVEARAAELYKNAMAADMADGYQDGKIDNDGRADATVTLNAGETFKYDVVEGKAVVEYTSEKGKTYFYADAWHDDTTAAPTPDPVDPEPDPDGE